MPVILRTKRSTTPGQVPSGLQLGEVAVNIPDKKIWIGSGSEPPTLLSPSENLDGLIAGDGISINTNNEINLDLSVGLTEALTIDKYDRVPFQDRTSTGANLGTKLIPYTKFLNLGLSTALSTDIYDPISDNNQKVTVAIQDNNPFAFVIQTAQNASGGKLNLFTIDTEVVGGANITLNGTDLSLYPTSSLTIGIAPLIINSYSITVPNATIMDFTSNNVNIKGVSTIEAGESDTVYIQGNLIVSGYIETDTGIRGNTNNDYEYLGEGMVLDGGNW